MKRICIFLLLYPLAVSSLNPLYGQGHQERYGTIDVVGYRFEIDLNDTSDVIRGTASVEISFRTRVDSFFLDLAGKKKTETGMVVEQILSDGDPVSFTHRDDRIMISDPHTDSGMVIKYLIRYSGIPADGLVISENKFGDRTFFGDNWPDRAHQWLPVVDHPSDRATVEFLVHAPGHYSVVANGSLMGESNANGRIFSHWKCQVPLPTKLMVIGVSPFAVQEWKSGSGIPVSSWVYPQNSKEGFYDYSIATRPLEFFEAYIAPYPFPKLANVQSRTVYGGMENASCIFYGEESVTGKQDHEKLFAHEIAHQWFGDAVSEMNWHHVWLSEGFATYLTDLYMEHTYGRDLFLVSLVDEKDQVLRFARRRLAPIVDTTLPVSVKLLNSNSYDKAAWVLHMLRREIGDELFRQSIRVFYEKYKYGNALTEDFREVVETVSGRDLERFFDQWFYHPGHPVLSCTWKNRRGKIRLTIKQHQQEYLFSFPLEIEIFDEKGNSFREILAIDKAEQDFMIHSPVKARRVILDPDSWLLFESL